jgi:KipI family sensor histidine kinase inhibitor
VTHSRHVRIVPAGDSAIVIELEARIDPAVNAQAILLAEAVHAAAIAGVRDVVPTYRSVTVFFDPLRTDFKRLVEWIEREADRLPDGPIAERPVISVPVCYQGELGPDLAAVAAFANMSEEDVIATHAGATYRVFMLGFMPGFAYMGTVDPRIAMPRRSTPRVRVPSGAVGIAGPQTGIYPVETPGGWQLIGRTALRPFDARRSAPFLFHPGDAVRFVPIDRDEFERHVERGDARPAESGTKDAMTTNRKT